MPPPEFPAASARQASDQAAAVRFLEASVVIRAPSGSAFSPDDRNNILTLLGIIALVRGGMSPRNVGAGDVLTVTGFGVRNGTNTANASSVTRTETAERLWTSAGDRD